MHKPLDLMLPEDWKQRTRVFVTRKKPSQPMTPMVSKAAYDSERESDDRAEIVRLSVPKPVLILNH
jgi:hypothetical protein